MSSLYPDTNYDLTFDDLNITPEFITTCIQDPFYSSINNGATDYNNTLSNDSFPGSSYQAGDVMLDRYNQSSKISSKFLDQISQDNDSIQTISNHAANNNAVSNGAASNGSLGNTTPNSSELSNNSTANQAVPKLKIKFNAKPNQNGHDVHDVNKVCKYSVVKDDTDIQCMEGESGDLAIDESVSEENLLGSISDKGLQSPVKVDSESPLKVDSESPRPAREKRPSLKFIESIAETIPDIGRVKAEPKAKAETKMKIAPSPVKIAPSPVKIEPKVELTVEQLLESHTPSSKENTPTVSPKKSTPPKPLTPKNTTPRSRPNPKFDEALLQPWPQLGEGWCRYEVLRKGGVSAGKSDVYYVGPDKKRVRSKPELQAVLGPNADLTCFSYRKGEFMSTPQGRNFTPNTEEVAKRLKWMKPKPALSGPLSMLHNIPAMISNSVMPSVMIPNSVMIPSSTMLPNSASTMITTIPSALTEAEITSLNSPSMLTSSPAPIPSSKLLTDSVLSMISSPVSNMISAIASSIKHNNVSDNQHYVSGIVNSSFPDTKYSEPTEQSTVSPPQAITVKNEPSTAPSVKEQPTGIEAMIQNFLSPFKNLPDTAPKEVYNLPRQDLDIPPNVTVTSSQPLPDTANKEQQGYRKKMMRCKECENCLRPNCGKCMYCLDMKKFGGNNSLRQTCIHRKCLNGLKVKIKLKRPRNSESPVVHDQSVPTMINAPKRQKVTQYQDYESFKRHQQSRGPAGTPGYAPVLTSYSAILRSIENSEVPNIYMFSNDYLLPIQINGISYPSTPLLWLDDIFHSQTIARTQLLTSLDEPPNWPEIMTRFYDFATRIFVSDNDITIQTKIVDKTRYQITKVETYVCQYGWGVKCPGVDVAFFDLLEQVELYQYLPTERLQKIVPVPPAPATNSVSVICTQLKDIIISSTSIETALRDLLVRFLNDNDLCKFILAVVNSNSLPSTIETQVVSILKTCLNLPGIESLTDLTGAAISQPPPPPPPQEEPSSSSSSSLLSETLACLSSGDKPLDEEVKNYILNQPLQVIDIITELQKTKPLTLENLSAVILEKIMSEGRPKTSSSDSNHSSNSAKSTIEHRGPDSGKHPEGSRQRPHNKTVFHHTVGPNTPANMEIPDNLTFVSYNNAFGAQQEPNKCMPSVPGYNPRYFTPHLGPQHQQRYGRPPLKRSTPPIGQTVHHIAPPPHTIHAKTVQIPSQITNPPWSVPNIAELCKLGRFESVSKSTQCEKETAEFSQQANLSEDSKSKKKFVDLNFCPHV